LFDLQAGVASDVGAVRKANEDSVFAGRRVFVVADGMGGHAAGDVASALAVARFAHLDANDDLRPADLDQELQLANEDILTAARENPEQADMGTTIAILALGWFAGSQHWIVQHAGDCRVYRYAQGELTLLTADHTEVAELVAAGAIDAADARTHPRRHIVTRALGSDPAPDADVLMLAPVPGERFLLCSDGLNLEVSDAEIARLLGEHTAAERAAAALVGCALRAGGRDNVSAVVVDYPDGERDAPSDEHTAPRSVAVRVQESA
jgi:protein phosphatase